MPKNVILKMGRKQWGLHDWAKVQDFLCFLLIDYNSVILSIRVLPLISMGLLDNL
jgi:hypothetical protein